MRSYQSHMIHIQKVRLQNYGRVIRFLFPYTVQGKRILSKERVMLTEVILSTLRKYTK